MLTTLGDRDVSGHSLSLCSNGDGTLEVAVAAGNGSIALLRQSIPGGWAGAAWTFLGARVQAETLALGRNSDGRLELAAVVRGQIQTLAQTAPGDWRGSNWQPLGSGPVVQSLALCGGGGGPLHIIVVGRDNGVYESVKTPAGAWSAWQALGTPPPAFVPSFVGGPTGGASATYARVVATIDAQDRVAIFTCGLGDAVYALGQTRPGTWAGANWYGLINSGSVQALAIGTNRDGRLQLAALDAAGVALIAQAAPGDWTGGTLEPLELGGGRAQEVARRIQTNADGMLDVFCSVHDDNAAGAWHLLHARQHRPGEWLGPPVRAERLAGIPEAIVDLSAGANVDGRLEVMLLTSQRVLRVAQLLPNVWMPAA